MGIYVDSPDLVYSAIKPRTFLQKLKVLSAMHIRETLNIFDMHIIAAKKSVLKPCLAALGGSLLLRRNTSLLFNIYFNKMA